MSLAKTLADFAAKAGAAIDIAKAIESFPRLKCIVDQHEPWPPEDSRSALVEVHITGKDFALGKITSKPAYFRLCKRCKCIYDPEEI